jgi:hypothetical protein
MSTTEPRWYLRPLYSRGAYSPRLSMAWLILLFTFWLIRRWITTPSQILNGVLVPPQSVGELVAILMGAVLTLVGYGTYQKVKLEGPPPVPEVDNSSTSIQAGTAPVSATNVTLTTANEQQ